MSGPRPRPPSFEARVAPLSGPPASRPQVIGHFRPATLISAVGR